MKKNLKHFLNCSLILASFFSLAQQIKIDSLQNLLKTSKEDSFNVNTLNALSRQYINVGNSEDAMQYAKLAIKNAVNLNYQKGIAESYNNIGFVYLNKGDFKNALDNYLKALEIQGEIGDKKGKANSCNNIGLVYFYQGNYEKAFNSHLKSLKIREEMGDKQAIAMSFNNIGLIYEKQFNYKKALDSYLKSFKICEESENKQGIAFAFNNIGNIYFFQGNYQKSLQNHLKALKLREEIGDKYGVAKSYSNIGNIYGIQNNFEKALEIHLKSIRIREEIGDKQGISLLFGNIGNLYMKQGKLELAYHYLNQSLIFSKEIGSKDGIKGACFLISELYDKKGDYKQAYNFYKLYSDIKDTLLNEQSSKQIAEMNTKYDSEKKDKELIKKDAEISKQQAERKRQNLMLNAFIIGFTLVLVLTFFIFRGYRQKRKANKLLEEKNSLIENQKQLVENKNEIIEEKQKEIIDSITYAKRIQNAILPSNKWVKEYLSNSFILYKPKDIVAGDFYWIEKVGGYLEEEPGDIIFIAAADCTGHGVPGAMVSVVCNNSLNRALREFNLRDPGILLNKTRELVIEQFEKSEEEVKDGMDISLCALNTKTNRLQWAGANNPLWIIRNGGLTEIKPDKQPIGKYIETKPFSTHEHQLLKGDTIYIFSDGYADQFGGDRDKKFKASAMKKLLLSIQHEKMEKQKELLEQAFENWKGKLEQVDDVLIIGIHI